MGCSRVCSLAATVAVGLTITVGEGCSLSRTFACTDDTQCTGAGAVGQCEPTGYCSFPDEECDSQSRYGSNAPPGLADTCVDPVGSTGTTAQGTSTAVPTASGPITDSTGDASGSTAPSTTAETTGSPGTDSGPLPTCGDGQQDPGEACDDGNRVDGDGCNVDCVISGTVLWTMTFNGSGDGSARARSVAVTEDGGLIVAGELSNDSRDGFVHRFDDDQITWTYLLDGDGGLDECRKAVLMPDGSVAVGGQVSLDGVLLPWVARLDAEGALLWDDVVDIALDGGATRGIASSSQGLIAAGGLIDDDAFVRVYDDQGTLVWEDRVVSSVPNSTAHGLVYGGDILHIAGWRASMRTDQDFWVRAYDEAGTMLWEDITDGGQAGSSNDRFHAALMAGPSLLAVGRTGLQPDNQVVAVRYGSDGEALQEQTHATKDASSALDAVIMPGGDVVIVGWESPEGDNPTEGWVRRYGPDGTLRWTTLIGDPDAGNDWVGGVALLDSGEIAIVGASYEGSHEAFVARLAP